MMKVTTRTSSIALRSNRRESNQSRFDIDTPMQTRPDGQRECTPEVYHWSWSWVRQFAGELTQLSKSEELVGAPSFGASGAVAVSYTHLTLPTIYSV